MQPTIVKAKRAHDFLALVPQLVGFLPENSVVLVAFRGSRTCGALRFNLPDPAAPDKVHRRIATTMIGTVCKIKGADAVVPVIYTDDAFASAAGLPHRVFAGVLLARAELSGFLVRDSLCVAADGWGSYIDPTCPEQGHPLDEIASSGVLDAVPDRRELATVHSGAALPRVDLAVKEKFARAFRRYTRLTESTGHPGLVDLIDAIIDPVETVEDALCWEASKLDLDAAAGLLHLAQAPAHRDQMMLQFAFGRPIGEVVHVLNLRYSAIQRITGASMDEIVRAELDQAAGAPPAGGHPDALDDTDVGGDARAASAGRVRAANAETRNLMLGMTERRPDVPRVLQAIEVLKAVVALAPRSARPGPLCMLAWLSWTLGRGSVAGIFIDQALAIDKRYSMAGLLCTLFDSGHLPEWAYAEPEFDAHGEPQETRPTGADG